MWETKRISKENKVIQACYDIPWDSNISKEQIINELSYAISKEIVNENLYDLDEEASQFDKIKKYTMSVCVNPNFDAHSISVEKRFEINGVSFTEEEIENALIKTYPYKLI